MIVMQSSEVHHIMEEATMNRDTYDKASQQKKLKNIKGNILQPEEIQYEKLYG